MKVLKGVYSLAISPSLVVLVLQWFLPAFPALVLVSASVVVVIFAAEPLFAWGDHDLILPLRLVWLLVLLTIVAAAWLMWFI